MTEGIFEKLADGLQAQINNLGKVVEKIDNKVQGNGKPGLVTEVESIKLMVQHIDEKLNDQEDRLVEKIGEAIGRERDHVQTFLKDTGKLREIAKQVAQEVVRQEIALRAQDFQKSLENTSASFKAALEEFKATQKEKETSPGSWRYFMEKWIIPGSTGVLITLLLQWLSSLLK